MSKGIVLIGGGGHCKSVLDIILNNKDYDRIVITDYDLPKDTEVMGVKVVGNDDLLPDLIKSGYEYAFITVGSIKSTLLRRKLYNTALEIGYRIPIIVDSSAVISSFASVQQGAFIGKNAVVNSEANIGDCAIINSGAIVEHECSVGNFSHVSVGAKLCGNVSIGNDTFIGAGTTIIQGISVGDGTIIGAGSVVLSNVENNLIKYGIVK